MSPKVYLSTCLTKTVYQFYVRATQPVHLTILDLIHTKTAKCTNHGNLRHAIFIILLLNFLRSIITVSFSSLSLKCDVKPVASHLRLPTKPACYSLQQNNLGGGRLPLRGEITPADVTSRCADTAHDKCNKCRATAKGRESNLVWSRLSRDVRASCHNHGANSHKPITDKRGRDLLFGRSWVPSLASDQKVLRLPSVSKHF